MRLDGWKSIGTHFGRERSTVIRWAAERGMPVHRIPGSGRGSVYALTEELDAWLEASKAVPSDSETQAANPAVAPEKHAGWITRKALLVVAALALVFVSLGAYAIIAEPAPREQADLPQDPEIADLYLEARSDWAERRPESIAAAIEKLQRVVAAEPGFAPAYASLADSYVLAREFGSLDDVEAFARAQSAADAALRIDPENASALRAAGFIEYWWRGDRRAASIRFRAAIAADPKSAQTHFWYGNMLVDNGDFAEGLAELERARLVEPALVPLQADIAWGRWSQGDIARARRELEELRERNGGLATIRDYLSVIYLAEGDIAGFLAEARALGEIRNLEGDLEWQQEMEAIFARDPAQVAPHYLELLEANLAAGTRTSLPWPLFVATVADDRDAVLRLLRTGVSRGEKLGSAGLMRHVTERWRGDAEIAALAEQLKPDSLVNQ